MLHFCAVQNDDVSALVMQTEKKVLAEQEEKDNAVRMRTNLSIPLLPEKEEDKKLAALLTYQSPDCKKIFKYNL